MSDQKKKLFPHLFSTVTLSLLLSSSVPSVLIAETFAPKTYSDEESFRVRKIVEFWKDGDAPIVENQIKAFLSDFGDSEFSEYFRWILGDIFLEKKQYDKALEQYRYISHAGLKEQMLVNELQCYYKLGEYETLYQVAQPFLMNPSDQLSEHMDEVHLFAAEALFNQALTAEAGETKKLFARQARDLYDRIDQNQYREQSRFAMARIHAILEEHEQAAKAFKALAKDNPDAAQDLLFEAATCEVVFDKAAALETFLTIQSEAGDRFSEATYNVLVILFQNGQHDQVISNFDAHKAELDPETLTELQLILGKSYFAMGNYENSSACLEKYIAFETKASSSLKNALLTQMNNASSMNNQELYDISFEKFTRLFPGDEQTSKALFIQALMLKEQGKTKEAFENLCAIREDFPKFANDKPFIFEYALLSLENEEFDESYDAILRYIDVATESEREHASKVLLSAAVHKHNNPGENPTYLTKSYFEDLCFVANYTDQFSKEESNYFSLIFGKAQFDMGMYEETIHQLSDTILREDSEASNQMLAKAHFLQGRCLLEGRSDHEASNVHLEKSLALDPQQPGALDIKLQIYNNCIALSAADGLEPSADRDHAMLTKAAANLFEVAEKAPEKVSQENMLWLANHYFAKTKAVNLSSEDTAQALDRASTCFRALLKDENGFVSIESENLFLEPEVLKYSKVLQEKALLDEKLALVKNLIQMQQEHSSFAWRYKDEALYELAETYKALGDIPNATAAFSSICGSSSTLNSSVAAKALFETTKIQFEGIAEKDRTMASEEVITVLENLKTLQIRKNPASEPVHLESALEYARIRQQLSAPEEQDDKYLFFLNRILEDYKNEEDLSTRAYHLGLAQDEKLQRMYNNYVQYIEAEQIRIKAVLHKKAGETPQMQESLIIAKEIMEEIAHDSSSSEPLRQRVSASLALINQDLSL